MTRFAKRRGIIFILSAPSGAGKTTLTNGLREHYPEIKLSVSCTTRARRNSEVNRRDYHFISEERFADMRANGEFAEWAKVHDHSYGTPANLWTVALERARTFSSISTSRAQKKSKVYIRMPFRCFSCRPPG